MERLRKSSRILIRAIWKCTTQEVANLISRGADVNGVDYRGNSALHHAIGANNLSTTKLLLEHGADIERTNDDGLRPFHVAFQFQYHSILALLLEYNAKIDVDDLGSAIKCLPRSVADLFYESVNVNEFSLRGFTALHRTVHCDDIPGIRKLLARGANPNALTLFEGRSALHYVKSAECVELLIAAGACSNSRDRYAITPLSAVSITERIDNDLSKKDRVRVIQTLLKYGADASEAVFFGKIALDYDKPWDSLDGLRIVLQYIALMPSSRRFPIELNIKADGSMREMNSFYDRCSKDISKMRKEILYDDVTFYKFLIKCIKGEVTRIEENRISNDYENIELKIDQLFPTYAEILKWNFQDVAERQKIRRAASICLNFVMPCLNPRHIVIDKILQFLHLDDMKNLISVYETNSDINIFL